MAIIGRSADPCRYEIEAFDFIGELPTCANDDMFFTPTIVHTSSNFTIEPRFLPVDESQAVIATETFKK